MGFYISNLAESESVNDFLIHQRLGVAKTKILAEKSIILLHFEDFGEGNARTATNRIVIRNHHVRIYFPAFRLGRDPW